VSNALEGHALGVVPTELNVVGHRLEPDPRPPKPELDVSGVKKRFVRRRSARGCDASIRGLMDSPHKSNQRLVTSCFRKDGREDGVGSAREPGWGHPLCRLRRRNADPVRSSCSSGRGESGALVVDALLSCFCSQAFALETPAAELVSSLCPRCHRAAKRSTVLPGGPDSPKSRGCYPRRRE
jgi:hypothetical protein